MFFFVVNLFSTCICIYIVFFFGVPINMQQLQKLQQTIGKTEMKQAWNKIKASS